MCKITYQDVLDIKDNIINKVSYNELSNKYPMNEEMYNFLVKNKQIIFDDGVPYFSGLEVIIINKIPEDIFIINDK